MVFNPYSEWLAIPPSQVPPTYYRLLGIKELESEPERIHQAALAQIARLRPHQAGEHADLTQRLMNEVSQARIVLTDSAKKAEYDRQILRGRSSPPPVPNYPAALESAVPMAEPDSADDESPSWIAEPGANPEKVRGLPGPLKTVLWVSFTTVILLGFLAAFLLLAPRHRSPDTSTPAITETIAIPSQDDESEDTPVVAQTSPPPEDPPSNLAPKAPPVEASTPLSLPNDHRALWQWKAGQVFPPGLSFPIGRPLQTSSEQATLSLDRPGRQSAYWLIAGEEFVAQLHLTQLDLPDGATLRFGGLTGSNTFVGARVSKQSGKFTLQTHGSPDQVSDPFEADVGRHWIEVFFSPNQCATRLVNDAGKAVAEQRVTTEGRVVVAVASMENPTSSRAEAAFDQMQFGTRDQWVGHDIAEAPSVIRWPDVDSLRRALVGRYEAKGPNNLLLAFSFENEEEVRHWRGKGVETPGVIKLIPGEPVSLGPVREWEWARLKLKFIGRDTRLSIDFSDAHSIEIDAMSGKVKLESAVLADFDPSAGDFIDLFIPINGSPNEGPFAGHTPKEAPSLFPLGTATFSVRAGEVLLDEVELEGDLELQSWWVHSLPPAPGPLGGDRLVEKRIIGFPEPAAGDGINPYPLKLANSADDEMSPFLTSDLSQVFFVRQRGDQNLLCTLEGGRARDGFAYQSRFTSPREWSEAYSPSVHEGGIIAYFLHRIGVESKLLQAARDPQGVWQTQPAHLSGDRPTTLTDVFLSPDGLRLFASRQQGMRTSLAEASRPEVNDPFSPLRAIDLPEGFRSPSVTADLLTMFLEGPGEENRSRIYRSRRVNVDAPWSEPAALQGLPPSQGPRGDKTPRIHSQGTELYFSSDREGGSGGLDLWVYRVDPTESAPAPATEPGVITDWLILGPLLGEEGQSRPQTWDELQKFFPGNEKRKVPKAGDRMKDHSWERLSTIGQHHGLYLIYFPFEVERTEYVNFEVAAAPGGVLLWLNGDEILRSNPDQPWQKPETLPQGSGVHRIRPSNAQKLTGIVCVGSEPGEFRIRMIDSKTLEPLTRVTPLTK